MAKALTCPHCGFEETIPADRDAIASYPYNQKLAKPAAHGYGERKRGARCEPCGALKIVDEAVRATRCAYCGAPMIIDDASAFDDVVQPEAIIPFEVDREKAADLHLAWFREKKIPAPPGELVGLYRPYWIFDAHTRNYFEGTPGEIRIVEKKGKKVEETRWGAPVRGLFDRYVGDLLVDAGLGAFGMKRYQLASSVKYDPRLLAGWEAERYAHSLDMGWSIAAGELMSEIRAAAASRIGGRTQTITLLKTATIAVRYRHVLLPLYVGTFQVDGKTYRVRINGQNGDLEGETPPPKPWRHAGAVFGLVFLGFVALLLWGLFMWIRSCMKS